MAPAYSAVIRLHFGDVESAEGQGGCGRAGRRDAHARHNEEEPPADSGRNRPPEGAVATSPAAPPAPTCSIETTRENLPAVLRLAGEILKEAACRRPNSSRSAKNEMTGLEFGKTEPQALACNRLERALYPFPKGDVRGTADDRRADRWKSRPRNWRTRRNSTSASMARPWRKWPWSAISIRPR